MKKKIITDKTSPGASSGSTILQHAITGGIVLSAVTMCLSLWAYFSPETADALFSRDVPACGGVIVQEIEPEAAPPVQEAAETSAAPEFEETAPPILTPSGDMGSISDLNLDMAGYQDDLVYSLMLDTAMGPMIYYHQGDSRWGEYLYGGTDPMKTYGCGPTAVSMLINSFSPQTTAVTPVELADWAAEHGYHASQSGSYHSIITDSLKAFGFEVKSVKKRTVDQVSELLKTGHILVALMGAGSLTENGHFILITNLLEDGTIQIADPNSLENSSRSWNLEQLLGELKKSYDSGGPLWAVSPPLS